MRDCIHDPDLPVFVIERGAQRAEVFDPRVDSSVLGARYVHGGYVRKWWHGDRLLTARAQERWDPYVGEGLPEVFELPLGRDRATEGEEYLRVGAGRMRKAGRDQGAKGMASTPVLWEVDSVAADCVVMSCADEVRIGGNRIGYSLTRSIRLDDNGLVSATTLTIAVPWNHPVFWFAHPFFAQTSGDSTAIALPGCAKCDAPLSRRSGDRWTLPVEGGLGNVTGLWGNDIRGFSLDLDLSLGGGALEVDIDKPLDHLVVFATPRAFSPEPQLARAWKSGETARWEIRYRAPSFSSPFS